MRYFSLLCLLFSPAVFSFDEVKYSISLGSERHQFTSEQDVPNLAKISFAYATENLDRSFSESYSRTNLYSDVNAKVISARAEKNNYGFNISYFSMNTERQTEEKDLIIFNPIGDLSIGYVSAESKIKAKGYRFGFHYVCTPEKLISYGPIVGIEYWEKQDILNTILAYQEDDGDFSSQIDDSIITQKKQTNIKKDSGFSPYGGVFFRFNIKSFKAGFNFKFYSQADFSYQSSALELGYQF
jgi:hypothetical protein